MSAIRESLIEQGFTREQIAATLRHWKIRPLVSNGAQVGEIMMQNNEVHFALNKEYRLKMGRHNLMRRTLRELVDEKGFLVTRLFKGDRHKRFVEFMGFRKIAEDAETETFWLDEELLNARN